MLIAAGTAAFTLIAVFIAIGSLAIFAWEIHRAPEGYEDASGFHALRKNGRVPGAGVTRTRPRSEMKAGHAVAKHA